MTKHEAIYKLYPNVITIRDEVAYDADGNEVTYDNTAVEAEISKNAYIEQRQQAYKPLAEQLDMQYWDAVNETTNWQDHINAIKTKYPKPE
jgi:acid stress-induced BolA-like protein IbaG/YrbA